MTLKISPHAIEQDQGPFIFPGIEIWNGNDFVVYSDAGLTEKFRIDGATGHIGIGTTPIPQRFINALESNIGVGQLDGMRLKWTQTLTGLKTIGNTMIDLNMDMESAGHNMTGDLTGIMLELDWEGAGTLDDMYGYRFDPKILDVGGTVTNLYGVYLETPAGAGAVTNLYGLYIEDMTAGGTLSYSIFTAAGKVRFESGTVHIYEAASGVTAHAMADTLIVEQSGSGGISILTPDASIGSLYFSCPSNNPYAWVRSDPTNDYFLIATTENMQFRAGATYEFVFNEDSFDTDFRIESDGNANMLFVDGGNNRVGIGRVPTSFTFEVAGSIWASGNMTLNSGVLALSHDGLNKIEIGPATLTGNELTYIDFTGDTTYTDYGFRIFRGNTGANAISTLYHRGTGALSLYAIEAASIYFYTTNALRWYIAPTGQLVPLGAGVLDIGSASQYVGEINYKTLTDRGCLGWYGQGVELQDGRIVTDVEALQSIKKHPTLLTGYGRPRMDYSTMPKDVYKPAPIAQEDIYYEEYKVLDDDPVTGEPRSETIKILRYKKGEKAGDDGAELMALTSIMIGAIKELDIRLKEVEHV